MLDQCLKILLLIGSYNAVVGQERNYVYDTTRPTTARIPSTSTTTPLRLTTSRATTTTQLKDELIFDQTCDFSSDDFCLWEHEPGAADTWLLNPSYDYDAAMAGGEAAFPFMYFEKPFSQEAGSVRLISHLYSEYDHYNNNTCFSFSYKVFRNSNSSSTGIRVYQKPNTLAMNDFLAYNGEAKKDYVLFEVWGDRGNYWYNQKARLKHFDTTRVFQIILEGIYDQDRLYIAVRNVGIQSCTENTTLTTTTTTSRPTTTQQPRLIRGVHDSLRCGFVGKDLCGWTRYPKPNSTNTLIDSAMLPINLPLNIPRKNRKAYLISPLYARDLDRVGCFYFHYELYRSTETDYRTKFVSIRVYQKPDRLPLEELLGYSDDARKGYVLFEDYMHLGICSLREKEVPLKRFDDNFQIIVEGFFTSGSKHVAISNTEIRECTSAKTKTTIRRLTTTKQSRISSKFPRPTTNTRPTTTQRPRGANDSLICDLVDDSLCGWTNYPRSIGSWIKSCYIGGKLTDGDCNGLVVYMPEHELLLGNRTAHLISPLYSRELDRNGCFYFMYEMFAHEYIGGYGRTVGIRVYQIPDYLALEDLLEFSDDTKEDYIIFEDRSRDKEAHFHEKEIALKHFDANFTIVIEGIFEAGPKFIKISYMKILQGSDCAEPRVSATTKTSTSTTTTTTTSPRPTTTQRPRGVNDSLSCYSDRTELCGWTNYPGSLGSWVEDDSTNDTKRLKVYIPEEYIERNRTAVLISPLYSRDLDKNGCFYFMYDLKILDNSNVDYDGRAVGIRVYQKPEHLSLEDLFAYSDDAKKYYIIHEVWGDLGVWMWRGKEIPLKHLDVNFQIIIEGFFGPGPRHIAIDEMLILQGSHCTSRS